MHRHHYCRYTEPAEQTVTSDPDAAANRAQTEEDIAARNEKSFGGGCRQRCNKPREKSMLKRIRERPGLSEANLTYLSDGAHDRFVTGMVIIIQIFSFLLLFMAVTVGMTFLKPFSVFEVQLYGS